MIAKHARNTEILRLWREDGLTLAAIGQLVGLTQERVRQIRNSALRREPGGLALAIRLLEADLRDRDAHIEQLRANHARLERACAVLREDDAAMLRATS